MFGRQVAGERGDDTKTEGDHQAQAEHHGQHQGDDERAAEPEDLAAS